MYLRVATISIITTVCLIVVSYSFIFTNLSLSQQENSKLTGFPVWYKIVKNESSIAWFGFLIILTFGSTITSLIFTHEKSISNDYISYFTFPDQPSSSPKIRTKSFNRSLAYYTLFTFISDLTLYILEPGKIWSSFSSFHNLFELIIILSLTLEGQFHKNTFKMFLICSIYIFLVNTLTISLKWPFDAIWFETQDLVFDFALVIVFLRIYFRTYLYQKTLRLPDHHEATETSQSSKVNVQEEIVNKFNQFTNQVVLLPTAAFVHIFGGVAILFNRTTGNTVFMLSNTVTFLMYSFYIYLDTHYTTNSKKKNIVLPHTPAWYIILIFLWSIIFPLTILRIAIILF